MKDMGHRRWDMECGIWDAPCSKLCAGCPCPLIQEEREALDQEDQEGTWHCPAHFSLTG